MSASHEGGTSLDARPGTAARSDVHHRRTTCRACGGSDLHLVLALGDQPLANAFLTNPDQFAAEQRFPLDVFFCGTCALVQLLDVVDPEVLFGHYLYVTGTSETIAAHNKGYARAVVERLGLGSGDLVAEIASNDGSLLSCFRESGVRVLGIEPARNIAEMARERGIDTVSRFFDRAAGAEIAGERGKARAIVANNVLAHVDDPVGFLAGCRDLLTDDGLVYVEVPWALEMKARGEYDTVYHEHLSYFSLTALSRIATEAGLSVVGVDEVPVHGGSIRVRFGTSHAAEPGVERLLAREREAALTSYEGWRAFGAAASRNREALVGLLESLQADGSTIAAYGAPAKGNTLLNFCGIGTGLVPWTVDRNPLKVGLYTPGMHLPVLPVDAIAGRRPDYLLILAWNFAEEIMRQQSAFESSGGRFIVPIPEPRVA